MYVVDKPQLRCVPEILLECFHTFAVDFNTVRWPVYVIHKSFFEDESSAFRHGMSGIYAIVNKVLVLDGELVAKTFLVYDALVISGTRVVNMYLNERLECISGIVKGILRMKSDPVSIKVKKFFSLKRETEKFFKEHLPSVTFKIDGLVFVPAKEPVRTGTHETMFKWKPRDANTIDFQFKRWDDQKKWGMYVLEKGRLIFESELLYERAPEWITDEDSIVECQYMCDEEPRWWKPLNLRTDKVHPNNRRTFYRTLVNIKEDIQIHEFIF
jgi:hypothetical protein